MNKISPWRILADHFSTLVDYPSVRVSPADIGFFFGLPLVGASVVVWFNLNLKPEVLSGILSAFSILGGLLLNLLVLVFSLTQSPQQDEAQSVTDVNLIARRHKLLREIHANISFAILIAFALVIVSTVALWLIDSRATADHPAITNSYYTFAIAFLALNFVLTVMMVLKRMHLLISGEFGMRKPTKLKRNAA